MKANFGNVLKLTLAHEGGYVNHPKDPGGATNYGVIQRTYDAFRDSAGKPRQSVKYITMGEVHAIYRSRYWHKVAGDGLPIGIDYTVFDASVNSGVGRGPKWTQKALGVKADGIMGKVSVQAMRDLTEAETVTVIKKAAANRLGFLKGLRHWKTFGRGWNRRVAEVEAGSIGMVSGSHVLREEAATSRKQVTREASGSGAGAIATGAATWGELPEGVMFGIVAVAVVLGVILVKRIVSSYDRAAMMDEVAETLDKLGD